MRREKVKKTNWHFDKLNKAHNVQKAYVSLHSLLNWASQFLVQCGYYVETSTIIYCINQYTGFYIIATLDWMF